MHVVKVRRFEGLNRWSCRRTLEATLVAVPAGSVPASRVDCLAASFEGLVMPPATRGSRDRLRPAPWPAFVTALAVEWQFLVREAAAAVFAPSDSAGGTATIAFECEEFELAEACLESALTIVRRLGDERGPLDLAADYERLGDLAYEVCFGGMNTSLVDAARARDLPVYRGVAKTYVQIGEGTRQRRFQASITGQTNHLAVELSSDKATAKALWESVGLPTAGGRAVVDAADAEQVARELGWPVAVKPADSDYGLGVALDLRSVEAVRSAHEVAQARSPSGIVLVERFLVGLWHRLLVVDDRLVAALRREPASVVGDGRSTLAELVAKANEDPRRGPDSRWPLYRMELGDKERTHLARSGLGPGSVPNAGECVVLRPIAHTETGATSRDVTDLVHPDNVAMAVDAVKMLGLDVAGLDVIAQDLARPLAEQGGGFLEINAGPAIFLHVAPVTEPSRPVPEAIIDALMPPPETGRVPLAVVVGGAAADTLAGKLGRQVGQSGRAAAVSTPARTECGGRRLVPEGPSPAARFRSMVLYPRTEVAILAAPARDLVDSGLGADRAAVLVLTGPEETWSEAEGRDWLERMKQVTPVVLTNEGSADDLVARVVAALVD